MENKEGKFVFRLSMVWGCLKLTQPGFNKFIKLFSCINFSWAGGLGMERASDVGDIFATRLTFWDKIFHSCLMKLEKIAERRDRKWDSLLSGWLKDEVMNLNLMPISKQSSTKVEDIGL